MIIHIEPSWKKILKPAFEKPSFQLLDTFIDQEIKQKKIIYPHLKDIFAAFNACPFEKIKVVILGQDPYHQPEQAHGLCFSVQKGVKIPPSLRNIFKELKQEYPDFIPPDHGNLEHWAKQGILMLNAVLTVEHDKAASHAKKGWEEFTDAVIQTINDQKKGVIFLLWGNYAKKKGALLDHQKHTVLESGHPSPLSLRFFLGCGHFQKVNEILKEKNEKEIEW